MKNNVLKVAEKIVKAVDRTKQVSVKVDLDRNSIRLLKKEIRSVLGFSNFASDISATFDFDIIINLETTNDRKFKTDLSSRLSRIRNIKLDVK